MSESDNARLRKLDLHIHTPQSICYGDKTVTPEQIVEAARNAKLDAIAITDHNTFESVESVRNIAKDKGLTIFPGVELSTKSGHFLALFEVGTPLPRLRENLDKIGVAQDAWGDGAMLVEGEVDYLFKKITDAGGIVIAAHIERWPSGFLETNEPRNVKMAIHASSLISALEITVSKDKKLWNNGEKRGFAKKYACIQSSDAHSPAEIGRRPVFIRMDTINLWSLKSAFRDYENSIFFPDDVTPPG